MRDSHEGRRGPSLLVPRHVMAREPQDPRLKPPDAREGPSLAPGHTKAARPAGQVPEAAKGRDRPRPLPGNGSIPFRQGKPDGQDRGVQAWVPSSARYSPLASPALPLSAPPYEASPLAIPETQQPPGPAGWTQGSEEGVLWTPPPGARGPGDTPAVPATAPSQRPPGAGGLTQVGESGDPVIRALVVLEEGSGPGFGRSPSRGAIEEVDLTQEQTVEQGADFLPLEPEESLQPTEILVDDVPTEDEEEVVGPRAARASPSPTPEVPEPPDTLTATTILSPPDDREPPATQPSQGSGPGGAEALQSAPVEERVLSGNLVSSSGLARPAPVSRTQLAPPGSQENDITRTIKAAPPAWYGRRSSSLASSGKPAWVAEMLAKAEASDGSGVKTRVATLLASARPPAARKRSPPPLPAWAALALAAQAAPAAPARPGGLAGAGSEEWLAGTGRVQPRTALSRGAKMAGAGAAALGGSLRLSDMGGLWGGALLDDFARRSDPSAAPAPERDAGGAGTVREVRGVLVKLLSREAPGPGNAAGPIAAAVIKGAPAGSAKPDAKAGGPGSQAKDPPKLAAIHPKAKQGAAEQEAPAAAAPSTPTARGPAAGAAGVGVSPPQGKRAASLAAQALLSLAGPNGRRAGATASQGGAQPSSALSGAGSASKAATAGKRRPSDAGSVDSRKRLRSDLAPTSSAPGAAGRADGGGSGTASRVDGSGSKAAGRADGSGSGARPALVLRAPDAGTLVKASAKGKGPVLVEDAALKRVLSDRIELPLKHRRLDDGEAGPSTSRTVSNGAKVAEKAAASGHKGPALRQTTLADVKAKGPRAPDASQDPASLAKAVSAPLFNLKRLCAPNHSLSGSSARLPKVARQMKGWALEKRYFEEHYREQVDRIRAARAGA